MLPVSAPFHCPLMEPAQQRLKADLDATEFRDLAVPLVNGWQARVIRTGAEAREGLYQQVPNPVRWTEVIQKLASLGVSRFIEVGAGGVLTGLLRNIGSGLECASVWKVPNLAKRKIWRKYMRQLLRISRSFSRLVSVLCLTSCKQPAAPAKPDLATPHRRVRLWIAGALAGLGHFRRLSRAQGRESGRTDRRLQRGRHRSAAQVLFRFSQSPGRHPAGLRSRPKTAPISRSSTTR